MEATRRADLTQGRTVDGDPQDDEEWEVFLLGRVQEWYKWAATGWECSLLEYLGMTQGDYVDWIMHDIVADRVKRVWRRGKY